MVTSLDMPNFSPSMNLTNLISGAISTLTARWLETALVLLEAPLLLVYLLIEGHLLSLSKTLPEEYMLRVILLLLILAITMLAFIVYLRPWIVFDCHTGTYKDKKTGALYCPSCKNSRKKNVPLVVEPHAWRCVVKECSTYLPNPDNTISVSQGHKPATRAGY